MVDSYRPADLKEALNLRALHGALPLAGGTDLMVRYKSWTGTLPLFRKSIMFISHLDEIKYIRKVESTLEIGGAATLTMVIEHPDTPVVLKDAVLSIAAPGLRNSATLAGNICNASPAGDSICALYVLDAVIIAERENKTDGEEGKRRIPVQKFITGPGKTDLANDELVTAIIIPLKKANINVFTKVGTRRANALSKLSFTGVADYTGGKINAIALAFGAVGPRVVRSVELEQKLVGLTGLQMKKILPSILNDYSKIIVPIDDQRSTAEYRKRVALNLLEDFLGRFYGSLT